MKFSTQKLRTYCLGASQLSVTFVAFGKILGKEIACSHLSCAILVRVEFSSHLKSLGPTAKCIVALVGVMENDGDKRSDSAGKGCHDYSKYPESTFILGIGFSILFSRNAPLNLQLQTACPCPAFAIAHRQ